MLNRLEIDRAVFYAIATRGWQFLAGPISILVIAAYFTPEVQGYYYTFASLMGIQTLVELGLHSVIINVSSHEWSNLRLDAEGKIAGEDGALRRLAGLKRFVARWYAAVALIFMIVCGLGGAAFLSRQDAVGVSWVAPWFCLVALNSLVLWAWAYSAMLEGCNQVMVVHRVRLLQFVTGSLIVWCSMAMGMGLWATVISVAVRLAWDYWMIFIHYKQFWRSLTVAPGDGAISWKHEIWPLQWKTAVMGIAGFLAFSLFTPVMLDGHGSAVAGQMGMTWTILTAIESAAYAWIHVRSSQFGMLAARRDWSEMDRVFRRLTIISGCFYFVSVVGVCCGVWGLNHLPYSLSQRLASRMLALEPTIIFACAFLLLHFPRCQTIYVRAHKQDPFPLAAVISHGLIAIAGGCLGYAYGPIGAAWGLLAVVATVNVPWWYLIWSRSRSEWHQPGHELGSQPQTG